MVDNPKTGANIALRVPTTIFLVSLRQSRKFPYLSSRDNAAVSFSTGFPERAK